MVVLNMKSLASFAGSERNSSTTLVSEQAQHGSSKEDDNPTEKPQLPPEPNTEQHPPSSEDTPPNGGLKAWLQVLAAFIFFMNSWGLINTFGTFQTYYKTTFLPTTSESSIAWIGSIRAFVLLGSPALYGPIFDLGHPHLLTLYGTLTIAFGIMMTSISTHLYQFILAQGLTVGLGSGALFLTAIAQIPTWFTTRKSLAMGIAASGSSIGGVIYPIIFRYLEPTLGFPWSVRIIAFTTLLTNLLACSLLRVRITPSERRAIFDATLFKDKTFTLWSLAWLFGNMGLYIPYFFIQSYTRAILHQPATLAFWTLTTINACSIPGRIIPGLLADATGNPLLIITLCTTISTILAFSWIGITSSVPGIFVFCGLYGFASGAFVSLSTPATVSLAPSMERLGTRLGVFNGVGSLGLLVGNPVAGAIGQGSWRGLQGFCGGACCCALGLLGVVVSRRRRRSRMGKGEGE